MKNKKLTKEEFNKMLPPGYWDMPAPEKVGDKFFNTATMEWDTVGAIETTTYSKKEWLEMMIKRGKYTRKQVEKYFSESELEKLFSEDDNIKGKNI